MSKDNSRRFTWQWVILWLRSCKEYMLLEVLNMLEPRRTSHQ